jgi:hypothetical protein
MMSFSSGPGKRSSLDQKSNASAQTEKAIPKGPKAIEPLSSTAPARHPGNDERHPLPSTSRSTNRVGNAITGRMSSAAISRRGSTSEYQHFHHSWQSLSSVKGGENFKDNQQRRISILAWTLDPDDL